MEEIKIYAVNALKIKYIKLLIKFRFIKSTIKNSRFDKSKLFR